MYACKGAVILKKRFLSPLAIFTHRQRKTLKIASGDISKHFLCKRSLLTNYILACERTVKHDQRTKKYTSHSAGRSSISIRSSGAGCDIQPLL